MEGCGKKFTHFLYGETICGSFEDLKHSDYYIFCDECEKKINSFVKRDKK